MELASSLTGCGVPEAVGCLVGNSIDETTAALPAAYAVGNSVGLFGDGADAPTDCVGTDACTVGNGGLLGANGGHGGHGGNGGNGGNAGLLFGNGGNGGDGVDGSDGADGVNPPVVSPYYQSMKFRPDSSVGSGNQLGAPGESGYPAGILGSSMTSAKAGVDGGAAISSDANATGATGGTGGTGGEGGDGAGETAEGVRARQAGRLRLLTASLRVVGVATVAR